MPSTHQVEQPYQPAPEIQAWLDQANALGNDLDSLTRETLAAARWFREECARRCLWPVPVEAVRDFLVPDTEQSVPVRLYGPQDRLLARGGKLPVVVFYHGGGWTLGSPAIYDSVTRALARQIPALVLSVDYRLAPEAPFPAAVRDAEAVLRWVRQRAEEFGGDSTRLVVAGDSAGGTLATVAARHARAQPGPAVVLQVLFYPSVNIASTDSQSYREYGENHLLTRNAVERFRAFYLPNPADWAHPDAAPLRAEELRGLPPTLLIGAGCDPLRDEGQAYAQKLRDQGNEVLYRLEPHLTHGFLNLYNFEPGCSPYAEGVLAYVAGVVRERLR